MRATGLIRLAAQELLQEGRVVPSLVLAPAAPDQPPAPTAADSGQQQPTSPAAPADPPQQPTAQPDPGSTQPLRFQDSDALRLINVEAEATAHPQFVIPPREEREGLPVGSFAQLVFTNQPEGFAVGGLVWVKVVEAREGRYEGLIDTSPVVFTDLLRCGMTVAFGPEHIAKIETQAAADADEVERQAFAQRHPMLAAVGEALAQGQRHPMLAAVGEALAQGRAASESPPPAHGKGAAPAAMPEDAQKRYAPRGSWGAARERTPEEWLEEAHGLYPAGRPCPCTTCRFARQAVQLQLQVVEFQRAAEAPESIGEAAVNRPPGYIVRGVDIPPGWMLVRLETAAGDYVITARIPAFLTLPAVLVWGDRTFALSRRAGGGGYHAHYRECFTVVVLQVADVDEDAAPQPSPGGEPLLSALPEPPVGEPTAPIDEEVR